VPSGTARHSRTRTTAAGDDADGRARGTQRDHAVAHTGGLQCRAGRRSLILVAAFFDAEPLGRSTSLVVTSFEGAEARGEVIIASDLDGGLSSCARNLDYDVHPERIALSQEEIAGVAVVRIAYDTDVCGEASGSYAHERAWVTIAPGGEPSLALHCTVGTESYVVSNEACESYDCDTQEYADLELELDAQGLRACRDPQTCRRFAWRDGTLFDPHSTAACAPP
jgi:hypothetical protein